MRGLCLHIALCVVIAMSAGCPKQRYRTLPDVPTGGNATARKRFVEARSRFERDGQDSRDTDAGAEFEAIAREYVDDPVAPYAMLYAGISAMRSGQPKRALKHLDAILDRSDADDALVTRGQLYRGLALVYDGRQAEAVAPLGRGRDAVADDKERVEWTAAMAEALAASGDVVAAIPFYDRFFRLGAPAEKAYALARIRDLGAGLSDADVERALGEVDDRGPAIAALGARLGGNWASAAAEARSRLGLPSEGLGAGAADPDLIGALLPMSGRRRRVGDAALRGLAVAAGTFDGGSRRTKPFTLEVEDSRSSAATAASATDALADAGAIGVVGPVDRRSVDAAGASAQRHGLPLIALDPIARGGEAMRSVFHIMHTAEDRARLLARYAVEKGVRDFAVLAPKNGYGRVVSRAFAAEVRKLGGQVVVTQTYDADETSFGRTIAKLRKPWKALFVADVSRRLELLAPALAAANFVSRPLGKRPRRGRGILLLSTAEALDDSFLRSAGRHAQGAILAPGFYADRNDSRIRSFVERFEGAYGKRPVAVDAYAYDAARALRAAVEAGAKTRQAVLRYLGRELMPGVTGTIAFDGARRRRDKGVLFTVTPDDGGDWAIRALR